MLNLKNRKVTIIGAKRSGLALARLVSRLGGKAKISDQGGAPAQENLTLKDYVSAVEFNGHTRPFIEDSDCVVLSPGVRFDADPVKWAQQTMIPVLGEIEFAFQFCSIPVIAVTGSNGKTTSSTLIKEVINASGKKACLCGNVGFPFSEFVLDLKDTDYVVLEISSFQLESLISAEKHAASKLPFKGFKPSIAVILNFSQNHLDRHKDLEEYFQAKKRIFLNQDKNDCAVLNHNNDRLRELKSELKSKIIFFDSPQDQVRGMTNPNHLAVLKVAGILGIQEHVCRKVFKEFRGVEHRLEWVRSLASVDYINDSKATTAEATGWALKNLSKPIFMICGGRDKNIDFSVLSPLVKKKVKKMIVIGEARAKIKMAFDGLVAIEESDSLENAVKKARQEASPGDCVILSPMCASFDMFKDYEDRGRVYKQIVNQLS